MGKFLGYGEDSLTLWAFKKNTKILFKKLGKQNYSGKYEVLYRPSFGRGGKSSFGEFDAILITEKNIYLFESKWIRGKTKKTFVLKQEQLTRHDVFKEYYEKLKEKGLNNCEESLIKIKWNNFRKLKNIQKKSIPTYESKLAKNIIKTVCLIDSLGSGQKVKNVLMLFGQKEHINDLKINVKGFDNIIKLDIEDKDEGWVFL